MKRRLGFEIGIWSIVVICITLIIIFSMLTGNFNKLIEALKNIN